MSQSATDIVDTFKLWVVDASSLTRPSSVMLVLSKYSFYMVLCPRNSWHKSLMAISFTLAFSLKLSLVSLTSLFTISLMN